MSGIYDVTIGRTGEQYSKGTMDSILRGIEQAFSRLKPFNPFGGFYQYEVPTTVNITIASTYVKITGNSAMVMEGIALSSDALTIGPGAKGVYHIAWTLSVNNSGSKAFEGKVFVDGVGKDETAAHVHTSASLDTTMGSTNLLQLNEGAVVDLRITNHTDTTDPVIVHLALTMTRVRSW